MNSSKPKNQLFKFVNSFLLWLAGGVAFVFFVFCFILWLCYAPPPLISSKISPDLRSASIIANAISTPPQPVPNWLNFFYPWQGLASAVFALVAALVGAWALMKQVEEGRDAVRLQIDAAATAAQTRYDHDEDVRIKNIEQERKEIAGAIAAEIRNWLVRFGSADFLQMFQAALMTARNKVPPTMPVVPIFVEKFPIYESTVAKLGLFEGALLSDIVTTYGALQGVLDAFRSVREGDYNFLSNPLGGGTEEALKRAKDGANRAIYGIEPIVQDLETLDTVGRNTIINLEKIHGQPLPSIPEWSKFILTAP